MVHSPMEGPSADIYRLGRVDSNVEASFQSSSTESLDSYTYDVVTAMQILDLAELLNAEPEPEVSPEAIPILSDSEESETDQDQEVPETTVDEVRASSTAESRSISIVSSSHSVTDSHATEAVLGRPSSRVSVSSSTSRIPRVCNSWNPSVCQIAKCVKMTLSRVSMTTNDGVISRLPLTPHGSARPATATDNRSTQWTSSVSQNATTSGVVTMRDHMFRSSVKSRLPLPFSAGPTTQHAHPQRASTAGSSLRINRLSTQTPDGSLRNENFSRASDQPSISRLSRSLTPGFLRPTKSSEAKASPQSPIRTERQKIATPSKPPARKPSWR